MQKLQVTVSSPFLLKLSSLSLSEFNLWQMYELLFRDYLLVLPLLHVRCRKDEELQGELVSKVHKKSAESSLVLT